MQILSKGQAKAIHDTICTLDKEHMRAFDIRFGNAIVSSDFNGTIRVIGTAIVEDERYTDQAEFATSYGIL